MDCLFREHFQCAVRNLCFLWGISLIPIVLCQMRNDNLHMAFRTKSSTLEQWLLICNTPWININSSFDVVQSISNNSLLLEEFIRVDIFCLLANSIQSGRNMSLQVRVHLEQSGCWCAWFWLLHVLLPEQELTGQVRCLNVVGIGNCEHAIWAHVHHGEVLQQFATDSSSTNNKSFHWFYLLGIVSSDHNLDVGELLGLFYMQLRILLTFFRNLLNHLVEMESEKLLYWSVLVCDCFYCLLRHYSTEICSNYR